MAGFKDLEKNPGIINMSTFDYLHNKHHFDLTNFFSNTLSTHELRQTEFTLDNETFVFYFHQLPHENCILWHIGAYEKNPALEGYELASLGYALSEKQLLEQQNLYKASHMECIIMNNVPSIRRIPWHRLNLPKNEIIHRFKALNDFVPSLDPMYTRSRYQRRGFVNFSLNLFLLRAWLFNFEYLSFQAVSVYADTLTKLSGFKTNSGDTGNRQFLNAGLLRAEQEPPDKWHALSQLELDKNYMQSF